MSVECKKFLNQSCVKGWDKTIDVQCTTRNIDGLVQDCSNSIANALELLQSCTKP